MATLRDETTAKRQPWTPRIFRFVRAGTAAGVVMACFGFIALRTTFARASDAGMNFGDELLHMNERNPSGELTDGVYQLNVNGQQAQTSNGYTDHSLTEVLDYFKAQCDQHAEGLVDKFADLDLSMRDLAPASGAPGYGTVRGQNGSKGFVFCASTAEAPTKEEQVRRFSRAVRTGDLGELGNIRYVAVREEGRGSQVAAAWTNGKFNLFAMFPREGDAPGDEFGVAPRPDNSRRILSGRIGGAPYGVNIYEVKGDEQTVFEGVDSKLKAVGWKPTFVPNQVPQVSHIYSRGDQLDIVVTVHGSSPTTSSVSYVVSEMNGMVTR